MSGMISLATVIIMSEFIGGFLSGALGPPLGDFLGRFRYPAVILMGFVCGLTINILFVVYEVIFGGGIGKFYGSFFINGSLVSPDDIMFAFSIAPVVSIACFSFVRAFSQPPTFEQAQAILDDEGYERIVLDEGRKIKYRKDGVEVVFRDSRRHGAPSAEWWRDGKRKGEILLREPIC